MHTFYTADHPWVLGERIRRPRHPGEVESSAAGENLERLFEVAGISVGDDGGQATYGWQDATWDSYWYSLYNMSTNISMSGNGVLFPYNEEQQATFDERFPKMMAAAGGEHGQAAVYNAAVEYDLDADEWSVTDRRFDTEAALCLANQDIWNGQWGGDFYEGRGVPGTNDAPS